ncbi:hypothetical protein RB213_012368 [Colletotrichum asianum]
MYRVSWKLAHEGVHDGIGRADRAFEQLRTHRAVAVDPAGELRGALGADVPGPGGVGLAHPDQHAPGDGAQPGGVAHEGHP